MLKEFQWQQADGKYQAEGQVRQQNQCWRRNK